MATQRCSDRELLGIAAVIVSHSPVCWHTRPGAQQMPPLPRAPCQLWVPAVTCPASFLPGCGHRGRETGEAFGELERHQGSGEQPARRALQRGTSKRQRRERAGSDRSGLKSHLSPSSYYVNYSCSLAAAAEEVIADVFWKHLLLARAPGPVESVEVLVAGMFPSELLLGQGGRLASCSLFGPSSICPP